MQSYLFMDYEFRLEKECPPYWNSQLLKSNLGTIFNTFEYSQYAKRRLNWEPLFLSIISKDGGIVGQSLIFEFTKNYFGAKFISKLSKFYSKLSKIIKWNYGPVTFIDDQKVIDDFLSFLHSRTHNLSGSIHPLYPGNFNKNNYIVNIFEFFFNFYNFIKIISNVNFPKR